jgi:hypothetical protein
MTRITFNLHRAFAGVLVLTLAFALANFLFDLGLLTPRGTKGLVAGTGLIGIIWLIYFIPRSEEFFSEFEPREPEDHAERDLRE